MKLGAHDYLVKDHQIEQRLNMAVEGALEKVGLQRQLEQQRCNLEAKNRQLEEALAARQASEAQLRLAFQTARMATWELDLDTNVVRWGPGLEQMAGLPAGTFGGSLDAFFELVHPDDRALVRERLDRALHSAAPYELEFRMSGPDGSIRWAATRGHVVRDAQGKPIGMIGIDLDVTERKLADEALRESEERYRALVTATSHVVWRADATGAAQFAAAEWQDLTGQGDAEMHDRGWRSAVHPDDLVQTMSLWRQANESKTPFDQEVRLRDRDGVYRYFQVRAVPVFAPDGSLREWIGYSTDITDRKQAEEHMRFLSDASVALAATLDYRKTLEQVAHLAIPLLGDACIIDLVGDRMGQGFVVVAHTDPEMEELLREVRVRYPPSWTSAHPVAQVLRSGRPLLVADIPPSVLDNNVYNANHQDLVQQLAPKSFLMVPFVVRGRPIGVISLYAMRTARQYTAEHRALAEELARRAAVALDNAWLYQEAQEAVRERDDFLSIASHELKNPLTSLLGRAQMLQRRLSRMPDAARAQEEAELIIGQARRVSTLLADLLDVSRLESGLLASEQAPLDLGTLVRGVAAGFQSAASAHTIAVTGHMAPIVVAGDAGRLEQVFSNLMSNAIKYSPSGGTIAVELGIIDDRARISISDTGLGIPDDALPHLFKRFYRVSRESPQDIPGSGIGLYVVKEIVSNHGGTIDVTSTVGVGSTFTVNLPLAELPVSGCLSERKHPPDWNRG